MNNVQLFLTRRNLLALLEKLDHVADGGNSSCTLIKRDTTNPNFPITGATSVTVTAVEDDVYYQDQVPGPVMDMKTGELK
jgi:hypothetical protein